MTLLSYNPSFTITRRHRTVGTKHAGRPWTQATRSLRAALLNAREHVPEHCPVSANELADLVIDEIDKLDPADVHLLAVVAGTLIRRSRRQRAQNRQ